MAHSSGCLVYKHCCTSRLKGRLLSLGTATILSSLEQGNTLTAIVENCPENVRYSGIAFSYNLGNALFGGSTPLVLTLLTEKIGLIAPAYYLIFMAGITLIAAKTLLSNNQSLGPLHNSMRSAKQMNLR